MSNFRTTFAAYRASLKLNGAALTSFLIAAGPEVILYLDGRIDKAATYPATFSGVPQFRAWAKANENAIGEAMLHYEW